MVEKVNWIGASGNRYAYSIFTLPYSLDPNQDGNYIYCKLKSDKWIPIYIGQGDLKDRSENHHQAACIKRKGATHFHCHLNATESARRAEEKDLLANYTQAYAPTGCNERPGG